MERNPEPASARFRAVKTIYATNHVKVRAAIDQQTGEYVAWKELICSEDDLLTARNEHLLQSRLNHPYINKPITSFESNMGYQTVFSLISEMMPSDLEKEITRRKENDEYFREEDLVAILGMTVSALAYCQSQNVTHRDVKPSNIFFSPDGTIKLGDFGSSREILDERSISLRGTIVYLSPLLRKWVYQQSRMRYDPFKSDVYSLGISILQLAMLKNCNEMTDLCIIEDLEPVLYDKIASLQYGNQFKAIVSEMLQIEEDSRPDCIQLAKLYLNKWIGYSYLMDMTNLKMFNCSYCRGLYTEEMCLCKYPMPIFCANCMQKHIAENFDKENHVTIPAAEASGIKDEKDMLQIRDAVKIVRQVLENLEDAKTQLVALKEARQNAYNQWKKDIEKKEESLVNSLTNLQLLIEKIRMDFNSLINSQISKKSDYIQRLQRISAPYFHHMSIPRAGGLLLSEIVIHEEISSLSHCDFRIAFPMFNGNRMTVYRPEEKGKSEIKSIPEDVRIDDDTSIALVNFDTVAICGGRSSPRQTFSICISSGDLKMRAVLSTGRISPSIAPVYDILYIFGGENALLSESVNLSSASLGAVASSSVPRYRCSACVHEHRIYLPAPHIEVYDPQTDSFTLFATLKGDYNFMSGVVVNDDLWVFTEKGLYSKKIGSSGELSTSEVVVGQFWSNPRPEVDGDFIYFFRGDQMVVKFNIKKKLKNLINI